MSQASDYKALARRAYLSYHQDGLIDVLIGWMAFGFGLYLLLESAAISFLAWFPVLFYVPIKNVLTIPRLGYVRFSGDYSQKTRTRLGLVLIGILVLAVLVITLFLLVGPNAPTAQTSLRENGMLIYGTATTLLLLIAGPLSGIGRLTVYGLLCALLAIAGMLTGRPDYLLFIVLGLAILLVGAILMIRFMRKYPLAHKGGEHDAE
jgi:hypothetical protein